MAEAQNLSNHRKFVPLYHFFVLPILLINMVWVIVDVARAFTGRGAFDAAVAVALLLTAFYARVFSAGAQDRVIRNEERARLRALLPADRHGEIEKFTMGQLVGMRFASDEELPELAKTVLANGTGQEPLKKLIKNWRADHDRI